MSKFTKFNNWRKKQSVILLDSAMGTGLAERHFNLNNNLWTAGALIKAPDKVRDVSRAYLSQGSNITFADTYQATIKGFEEAGYTKSNAKHYIQLAVKLAEEGRAESTGNQAKFIGGAVGPYGAALHNGAEYTGHYHLTTQQYINFHADRFRWLVEAGCDLIKVCTMPNFAEIKAVCQILKKYPQMPIIFTCTLKDGHHISDGTDLRKVQSLFKKQPSIVGYGINCCPPKYVVPAIKYLRPRATTDQDIVVYPNAGADYDPKTKTWGKPIPHVYSRFAPKWHQVGAKCVGGCCVITEKELSRVHKEFLAKE